MAVKKIIDIDVQDEAFKRFMDLFNQFEEKVADLPAEWKSVDDAMNKAGKGFAKGAGDGNVLLAGMAANAVAVVDAIHESVKAQRQFEQNTRRSHSALKAMSVTASGLARTISGIVKTGLALGGIGGAATMWGLDALANSAMSRQRSALGTGMTPGQQAAFGTYFSQFGNADSVAESVANARNDVSKRWAFSGAGISQQDLSSKGNFGLNLELMQHAQAFAKATPDAILISKAQALGYTQLGIDPDMLRRLKALPTGAIFDATKGAMADQSALGFTPEVARQWTDFSISLHRAGIEIESSLITGLHKIAPPLNEFSRELSDWISKFMTGPTFGSIVDEVSSGLQEMADYVGSPKFKNDLHDFGEAVSQLTQEFISALRYMGLIPGVGASGPGSGPGDGQVSVSPVSKIPGAPGSELHTMAAGAYQANSEYMASLAAHKAAGDYTPAHLEGALEAASKKYGVPLGLLQRVAMQESSFGRGNMISSANAKGFMQFIPSTGAQYGITDFANPDQSADAAGSLFAHLLKHYNGNQALAAAAYNAGEGAIDKAVAMQKATGRDWTTFLNDPSQTAPYAYNVGGGGSAKLDAQVRARLAGVTVQNTDRSTATQVDPLAGVLRDLHRVLKTPTAQKTSVVISNQTGANVAVQANAAAH